MIRYGDEIGMGDDLSLEGRDSVRTPMQWTREPNGGFSRATGGEYIEKIIDRGTFGYKKVNVLDAQADTGSLLNYIQRLISIRKQCPEIGTGKLEVMDSGDERLLLHHFKSDHGHLWFVHNFSGKKVSFDYSSHTGRGEKWVNVFASNALDSNTKKIQVAPYGFRWWRAVHEK